MASVLRLSSATAGVCCAVGGALFASPAARPRCEGGVAEEGGGFRRAVEATRALAAVRMAGQAGTPGVAIAVAVDGRTVMCEGLGLADVEQGVPMSGRTVLRCGRRVRG